MKNLFFVLTLLFSILTFIGVGYIVFNRDNVNIGRIIFSLMFAIIAIQSYKSIKK